MAAHGAVNYVNAITADLGSKQYKNGSIGTK